MKRKIIYVDFVNKRRISFIHFIINKIISILFLKLKIKNSTSTNMEVLKNKIFYPPLIVNSNIYAKIYTVLKHL